MAINKAMKMALKALSYQEMDLQTSRNLTNLKAIDPLKRFYKTIDYKIYNDKFEIPIRIYLPNKANFSETLGSDGTLSVLLFMHGGGWVTESIETYNKVCLNLAQNTNNIVVSIGYRLAPEYKFPNGLEDCYCVAKALYLNKFILNADPDKITLIGDSAGGNLAAALSLMARDRKEFFPLKQILIYPCLNNSYINTDSNPFKSVIENGNDYLLTSKKIQNYIDLYKNSDDDLNNPYFAPLLSNTLKNQPKTLIITSEFDPLRDEAEYYGERLKQDGNEVYIYRLKDALHGYFGLGPKYFHVRESYKIINQFLNEG